jgi:hypothetical protein
MPKLKPRRQTEKVGRGRGSSWCATRLVPRYFLVETLKPLTQAAEPITLTLNKKLASLLGSGTDVPGKKRS